MCENILQIWVYGNSFESYLVAVVCPSKIQIEHWAKDNNVSGDFESICQNQKTKEFILGEFKRVAKDKKLRGFELIKSVHLDTVPFDMDRDLITPSYKKKRPQLLKYYQVNSKSLYHHIGYILQPLDYLLGLTMFSGFLNSIISLTSVLVYAERD